MCYDTSMDGTSLFVFAVTLCVAGFVTVMIASDYGPRAALSMGLGGVVLSTMLGAVAQTTGTPMVGAAALAIVIVAVLAIFVVGLNRWLPRS